MSATRLARIPYDHVVAELAAFPIASEAALALAPVMLDPRLCGETGRLWRATESALTGAFPSLSIDETVALRDRLWFGSLQPQPLDQYLRGVANLFLESRGDVAVPRLPRNEQIQSGANHAHTAIARRASLWLGFALPADLFLAALGDGVRSPTKIDLLAPALARQLREQRFAETHLHFGAALEFPLLWNMVLLGLADPALRSDAFRSAGAAFAEGATMAPWLLRAALARCILADYLVRRLPGQALFEHTRTDFYRRVSRHVGAAGFTQLLWALEELGRGRLDDTHERSFSVLKSLYAQLTGIGTVAAPRRLAHASNADPLHPVLPTKAGHSPEVRFVALALRHLERARANGKEDAQFARLFWQIVRVRSLFYRHVVQRPLTPGLQWFVRTFGRARPARQSLHSETLFESAAHLCGAGVGLRSLEVRTSPEASVGLLQRFTTTLDDAARRLGANYPDLEFALVFHFTKRREGGADAGTPRAGWRASNADPRSSDRGGGNPSGFRYARFYSQRRSEAQALAWLLCHRPLSVQFVRAVDVCTDELGVPNWVMAPLLERVRRAADEGTLALRRLCGWAPPPLRTTVHAGEDFVHLLTGLRHVDEAIEQLGLREGDRIGHGLALGLDAVRWAGHTGRIAMLSEDRLFDLVWEWNWRGQRGGDQHAGRSVFLTREIAALSQNIFEESITPYELALLREDLCNPYRLRMAGFPDRPPPTAHAVQRDARLRRLVRFLTDAALFDRGRQTMWVDPCEEGETLHRLQAELRTKLSVRGLTVEVNPTSNLLIGDLGDLTTHPLWRMQPPRGGGDAPPLSICIGSDDPLVFASNLRQEYQFLADALTLAGLSDDEARGWIHNVRSQGLDSRFTEPRRISDPIPSLLNVNLPLVSLV